MKAKKKEMDKVMKKQMREIDRAIRSNPLVDCVILTLLRIGDVTKKIGENAKEKDKGSRRKRQSR